MIIKINEIWKPIKSLNNIYEVSNLGNVRSIDRIDKLGRHKKGKVLSKKIFNTGYEYVSIFANNKKQNKTIHRLVAEAFIDNFDSNLVINHKDGNKQNNCVNNLEVVTQKENIKHSWEHKLSKRTRCKKINQYTKDGKLIKSYNAIMDAERETGISNSKITACCKKHYGRKTAGGYIWRYQNENYN